MEEQASLARAEHPCVAGDSLPPNAIVVVRYLLCSLVPEHKCWLRVCCMVTVRSLYISVAMVIKTSHSQKKTNRSPKLAYHCGISIALHLTG